MTEDEWLTCCDTERMLAFLGSRASERKRRLFHCACCRRISHFMQDNRGRDAVIVAEHFAEGIANLDELAAARRQARYAVCAAELADYTAEAETNFTYPPEYLALGINRFALLAAKAAVSEQAADSHGGWDNFHNPEDVDAPRRQGDPARASDYWAAAAVSEQAKVQALMTGMEQVTTKELQTGSQTIGARMQAANAIAVQAKMQEHAVQARLLRCLFSNPFQSTIADPAWRTDAVISVARTIDTHSAFDQHPIMASALAAAGCTNAALLDHCHDPGPHARGCWAIDLLLGKE